MNTNNETQGQDVGAAVAPDDERAAGLSALMAEVEQPQTPGQGQGEGQGQGAEIEPQAVPLSVEIADAITASVALLSPMFPTLEKVYTEQTVQRLSVATERVCVKRGWLQNGLFGGASDELMLAAVAVPVALSTWSAIRADLVAAHVEARPWLSWTQKVRGWVGGLFKRKERQEDQPQEVPGANVVTVGTVAPA